MSRSKAHFKGPGYDYWSIQATTLGKIRMSPGRWTKTQTHRAWRRHFKRIDREEAA